MTRNVKDYQEKSHFGLGKESYPKLTTTWTAFSKKLEKPRGLMGLKVKGDRLGTQLKANVRNLFAPKKGVNVISTQDELYVRPQW